MSYTNPIYPSGEENQTDDRMDGADAYIEIIKENIEYDHHMKYDEINDRELYDELFELICEVVCVKRTTIRIAGEEYPYGLVKSKFLKAEEQSSGVCDGVYERHDNKKVFKHYGIHGYGTV